VDLDLIRAGGLTIYRNESFLPRAWLSDDPAYRAAVRSSSLLDIARLRTQGGVQALDDGGTVLGASPSAASSNGTFATGGVAVLSQQFDAGWRAQRGSISAPPSPALGWATGFDLPRGTGDVRLEYGRQWIRTAEMIALAALWVISLWLTRKPSGAPRPVRPARSANGEPA
jgi:hypothetical protein